MEINEGLINLDSRGTVLSTINSIRSRERIEPASQITEHLIFLNCGKITSVIKVKRII